MNSQDVAIVLGLTSQWFTNLVVKEVGASVTTSPCAFGILIVIDVYDSS